MERGIDEQFKSADAEISEADPLGVAQKPGGLVVGRIRSLFKRTDSEGDGYFLALGAKRGAWRSRVHQGNLTVPGPLSPFRDSGYMFVNLFTMSFFPK